MIVDFPASGLDNVDVFPTHGFVDLHAGLPHGELGEHDIALGDAEMFTYGAIELWMGASAEDHKIPNHGVVFIREKKKRQRVWRLVKMQDEVKDWGVWGETKDVRMQGWGDQDQRGCSD